MKQFNRAKESRAVAETTNPVLPFTKNTLQERYPQYIKKQPQDVLRTSAFFGGPVSGFIRFGGGGDTSALIAAVIARGGESPLRDAYGQTGGCWHCQKPWPDMIEGWLTWTPQSGRPVMYGVCFPCHRSWVNADTFSRVLIEQRAQANLIRHYAGTMEVAA